MQHKVEMKFIEKGERWVFLVNSTLANQANHMLALRLIFPYREFLRLFVLIDTPLPVAPLLSIWGNCKYCHA